MTPWASTAHLQYNLLAKLVYKGQPRNSSREGRNCTSGSPFSLSELGLQHLYLFAFFSQLLLKSVYTVFVDAIAATEATVAPFLELNQARFDPAAIPARRRFLMRRYKLLRNLLQWRKYAGDRYGLGALASKLVSKIMLPVAETGWEVGGEETMRKVRLESLTNDPLHFAFQVY